MPRPFHLALPCRDIEQTRRFYCELLECRIGRSSDHWIDLDFFGHQLVFHLCGGDTLAQFLNPVDRDQIPIPHFGVVLEPDDFSRLADKLAGNVSFIIEPSVRFAGTPGEQHTLFFEDPNGLALEFKAFADDHFIFAPFSDETQH